MHIHANIIRRPQWTPLCAFFYMTTFFIANKYKLLKPIGEGAFGQIYEAENIRSGEKIAIKSEPIDSEFKMLKHEAKIYQSLDNSPGFPQVKWYGIQDNKYFMALTLLGQSLAAIKKSHPTFPNDPKDPKDPKVPKKKLLSMLIVLMKLH